MPVAPCVLLYILRRIHFSCKKKILLYIKTLYSPYPELYVFNSIVKLHVRSPQCGHHFFNLQGHCVSACTVFYFEDELYRTCRYIFCVVTKLGFVVSSCLVLMIDEWCSSPKNIYCCNLFFILCPAAQMSWLFLLMFSFGWLFSFLFCSFPIRNTVR